MHLLCALIFSFIFCYVSCSPQFRPSGQFGTDQSDEIHKHIFAYVAPDDGPGQVIRPEYDARPETHYKILFIKAPQPAIPRIDLPSLPSGPDVRTLVYVLQPKQKPIDVPAFQKAGTEKPKPPQVFFIKYDKTQ